MAPKLLILGSVGTIAIVCMAVYLNCICGFTRNKWEKKAVLEKTTFYITFLSKTEG